MKIWQKYAALAACAVLAVPCIKADELSDLKALVLRLERHTESLEKELDQVRRQLSGVKGGVPDSPLPLKSDLTSNVAATIAPPAEPRGASEKRGSSETRGYGFMERKPGKSLTFYTPGGESEPGEITMYGNMDLSFDGASKGLGVFANSATPPVGRTGWLPALSTNISYAGVRGFQPLFGTSLSLVYQFETQIDVASTSGTSETNSSESNVVKGALTSRNTYIGLASDELGALKFGKTDAPYKSSTMRMNPFYGMQGDYHVIMGNTGGDNRVEFGTRLDHSIWYESPVRGGVAVNLLFSPGQNRAGNSDNLAAGESDCTGGNVPGSGGIVPVTCSDGSFSDAVSGNISYTHGRLYATAAYERHMKVNRSSDITGLYASGNAYSQLLVNQDTADEDAAKVGLQYAFRSGTSVSGIFESMHRYVPADLEFQNERQRNGTWLALSQKLDRKTSMHFGWAHAFRTPGDPGQHNDSLNTPPGGVAGVDSTAGLRANNQANLYTSAFKYQLTPSLGLYSSWATTLNGPAAHYDLGAGGRTITTDCHDAFAAAGGLVASNPHCYTGTRLEGASLGMGWRF